MLNLTNVFKLIINGLINGTPFEVAAYQTVLSVWVLGFLMRGDNLNLVFIKQ